MSLYLTKSINIPVDADKTVAENKLLRLLCVNKAQLKSYRLYRKSVDARNKSNVHFVCSYVVDCAVTPKNAVAYTPSPNVLKTAVKTVIGANCIVVGAGPAGLFAAAYLVKCGFDVTVMERGYDLEERRQAVQSFFDGGDFDTESNVQFGLGGAGTFSDGKLTSGISSPLVNTVLEEFVECGADEDILYDALPHVGTDKLSSVVFGMRNQIIRDGGRFLFGCKVCDLILQGNNVVGVIAQRGGKTENYYADCIVIACGNSARDTFEMLGARGADLQFKPFAVGLRIEHKRKFIDVAQRGELALTHRDLQSASYKLTHKCRDGRGCYTFCMCPGGVVVAANSERDSVVVNGMSFRARDGENSNSAVVVTVSQQDVERYGFGSDAFAGIRFQRYLERAAYNLGGGGYVAPCQNTSDFVENKPTVRLDLDASYPRGVKIADLRKLLPQDMSQDVAEALTVFDAKIKGFASCGVLTGVETRTSSPLRILRDQTFQSNLRGLYPMGEGAGYAGGIVSSAVDGLKVAMSIVNNALQK